MERSKNQLREKLLRWMPKAGDYDMAIEGVRMHWRDETDQLENCIYKPLATVVVQGASVRSSALANIVTAKGIVSFSGVDMPSTNYITSATKERVGFGIKV